jgi:thioredoxin reductase (NADPH)
MGEVDAIERDGDTWAVVTAGERQPARAVVVATGARPKPLGIPGEERLTGRGVSHCATCDGPLFGGKTVGVVGGDEWALHEAVTLASFVANVIVLSPGPIEPRGAYARRAAELPNVEIRESVVIQELAGATALEGALITASSASSRVPLSGLFVYAGTEPNTSLLADLLPLHNGLVPTDAWMRSDVPGLLAVGDARCDAAGYALTAAADGALAAIAADRYVATGAWR